MSLPFSYIIYVYIYICTVFYIILSSAIFRIHNIYYAVSTRMRSHAQNAVNYAISKHPTT